MNISKKTSSVDKQPEHQNANNPQSEPAYPSELVRYPVQIDLGPEWTAAKDMDFFDSIWGTDIAKGDDPYAFAISRIVENQSSLSDKLDQAIDYLHKPARDSEALE